MIERRAPVSAEEFVRIWQTSSSLAEIARLVGASSACASERAMNYRKRGIHLKKFNIGRAPLDVAALNEVIKKAARP